MMSEPLTFANMLQALLRDIPELKPRYDREMKHWGDEMGQHIMYRYVLYSAIEDSLKRQSTDMGLLRKMFDFLENLVQHPEAGVREVAHQSVCDKICADEVVLQKAQPLMGKHTRELCLRIVSQSGQSEP